MSLADYDPWMAEEEASDSLCLDCGNEWAAGWLPGSRTQPGEYRVPECPVCGSDESEAI
jgi:DNA-directed RNA polymerase subunit RPC12/RpoP